MHLPLGESFDFGVEAILDRIHRLEAEEKQKNGAADRALCEN